LKKKGFLYNIFKYKTIYLFMLPGILYYIVFAYFPMYGILVAFQNYNPVDGIAGSPWVGLENFKNLFSSILFGRIVTNTLIISAMKLILAFPLPILLAIMLSNIRNLAAKRIMQTISYLPHFISWVIVAGLVYIIFNSNFGVLAGIFKAFGMEYTDMSRDPNTFRWFLLLTTVWKTTGWNTILYLAAITGVDEELYEAAKIDGANKFQQIMKILMPSIMPTIAVVFILNVGSILAQDFEQIYVLSGGNPSVLAVADVLESYVFREGIRANNFSFPATVGIFQSVFGLILIMITNKFAHKLGYEGIW